MARIIAGVGTSHTPAIGAAIDKGKTNEPYWVPVFEGYEPARKWMDEVNPEFARTDVALVIGANDVTNPAARRPGTAISGMPILDVDKAATCLFVKRSLASGYAGIDNTLFYKPATMMLFGDAKKMTESIVKAM